MGQSDRWGDLAAELGIQESAASAAPRPAPPVPPKTVPPISQSQAAAPRATKPSTDWSRLAEDLGLDARVAAAAVPPATVSRPPVSPASSPAPARATEPARREPRPEPRQEQSQQSRPAAERDRARSPEPGYDYAARESSESEASRERSDEADASYERSERETENRERRDDSQPRRRRRRGRGGRGRGQRPDGSSRESRGSHYREPIDIDNPPEFPDTSDVPWSAEPAQRGGGEYFEAFDEPEMLDEDGLPVSEASLKETEPRKRRRRRGGRGRKRREQNASEVRTESPQDRPADDRELRDFDRDEAAERGERKPAPTDSTTDADYEHESELSGGHRAVPSWEEAVGVLVSANLEARAKNPEARGSHRNRHRGRGGQGKRGSR